MFTNKNSTNCPRSVLLFHILSKFVPITLHFHQSNHCKCKPAAQSHSACQIAREQCVSSVPPYLTSLCVSRQAATCEGTMQLYLKLETPKINLAR